MRSIKIMSDMKYASLFLLCMMFSLSGCGEPGRMGDLRIEEVFEDSSSLRLAWAVEHGDLEAVKKELKEGTDPNAKGSSGITPVWWAVARDRKSIVFELLNAGGDPNVAPQKSRTTMEIASSRSDLKVLRLLIEKGGDVELTDSSDGRRSLHGAAMMQNLDAIELLVDSGADIEARTNHGYTPLIFSIMANAYDSALLLVELGADLTAVSNDGTNVREFATRKRMDPKSEGAMKRDKLIAIYDAESKKP